MLRVIYTPLPKSSKDELCFLMLPHLFGFCWPATGQVPGRKSAKAELQFCLSYNMQKSPLWSWPLLIRGRETCSLGFCWGISDSMKNLAEIMQRSEHEVYISISICQLCCAHQLSKHHLVLLWFSSLKSLKTTDAQYYKYIVCSVLKRAPEIWRHWRWSVVLGFKSYSVSVT